MKNSKANKINNTGITFKKRGYAISDFNIISFAIRYMLTAVSVYLIVYTGFSSFNIEVDYKMVLKIDAIISLVLSFANLNIITLLIANGGLAYLLYSYINSNYEILKNGILSIMNDAYTIVRTALSLPEADGFDKVMTNTDITINMVAGVVTVAVTIIIAIVVGRLMSKILYSILISAILGGLTIMGCDINIKYISGILLTLIIVCIISETGNSSLKLGNRFRPRGRNTYIKRGGSLYTVQLCIIAVLAGTVLYQGISGIYKQEIFNESYKNNYSDNLKVTARDIAVMKYVEYKEFGNQKSFDNGQVGYQAYFRPSMSKKETIKIKPVRGKSTLIEKFRGQNYVYRMNMWTEDVDSNDSGKYLEIDERNKEILDKICSEQNFSAAEDIPRAVADYLIDNYKYTLEAEVLPYGKDFVNYFLTDTKAGNATHFASAAVLLFRNMGIPARYVSGYKIDYEQAVAGKYNRSSGEFSVDVSTANSYAWAEVYDAETGWTVVNVSEPPSIQEIKEQLDTEKEPEPPATDIGSYFRTVDKSKYSPENIGHSVVKLIFKVIIAVAVIIITVILLIFIYREIREIIIYFRSDNARKAIILIENYKKGEGIDTNSFKELKCCMTEKGISAERADKVVQLAEKIIFSPHSHYNDVKKLRNYIKSLKK